MIAFLLGWVQSNCDSETVPNGWTPLEFDADDGDEARVDWPCGPALFLSAFRLVASMRILICFRLCLDEPLPVEHFWIAACVLTCGPGTGGKRKHSMSNFQVGPAHILLDFPPCRLIDMPPTPTRQLSQLLLEVGPTISNYLHLVQKLSIPAMH